MGTPTKALTLSPQVGDYNTNIDEKDTAEILHKCDTMVPGLRGAQVKKMVFFVF
jgi:hypothetical protein